MSEQEPAAAAPPPKKKRSKGLLIGVVAIVLLASAGGGGWWYFTQRAQAAEVEEVPEPEPPSLVTFEPFTVNLADGDGRRFLRVAVRLLVAGEDTALEIEEDVLLLTRVRSALLELLATQTSAKLSTPDGKTELKKAIADTATTVIGEVEVTDVLFAEFVVQ